MAREPLSSRLALLSPEPQRELGAGEQGWDEQNDDTINNNRQLPGPVCRSLNAPDNPME